MKCWTSGLATAMVIGSCAVASAQTAAPATVNESDQGASAQTTQTATQTGTSAGFKRFTERVNITAIPSGVVFVRQGDTALQPGFNNYVPGAAVAVKLTDRIDVEGELAWGIGRTQDLKFHSEDVGTFKSPDLFGCNGNVLVNLVPSDHMFVPYAIGGIGGMHVSTREELGIDSSENFLTGDFGGGAKVMWGPIGIRGDYRFFAVRTNNGDAPFLGDATRYGHRIYAGVVIAPGRHKTSS